MCARSIKYGGREGRPRYQYPDRVLDRARRHDHFSLLTCDEQLEELRRCFGRPSLVPGRIRRHEAGRLINQVRTCAEFVDALPAVDRSSDPFDNFLLALAEAGAADFLVTGDKAGLLNLKSHGRTQIVTAGIFVRGLCSKASKRFAPSSPHAISFSESGSSKSCNSRTSSSSSV